MSEEKVSIDECELQKGLTDEQKAAFMQARQAENVVLIDGVLDGERASIIAAVFDDKEDPDIMVILPMFVECTPKILDRLQDCEGDAPTKNMDGPAGESDDERAARLDKRYQPKNELPIATPKRQKLDS